jgi:hypothetical protein
LSNAEETETRHSTEIDTSQINHVIALSISHN